MGEKIDRPGEVWVSDSYGFGKWLRAQIVETAGNYRRLVRITEGSLSGNEVTVGTGDVREVTK